MGEPRTTLLRSVLVAAAACAAVVGFALPASAAAPLPDPGFGSGGVVTDPTKGGFLDVLAMGDGGFAAVAGYTHNDWKVVDPAPGVGFVERYDAHGVPIASFGTDGRAAVGREGYDLTFYELQRGPGGTLVLIGTYVRAGACGFAVARLSASSGALDAAFGTGGLALAATGGTARCQMSTGTVLPGGRVIVAESHYSRSAAVRPYLVEFNVDGKLDPSFGVRGRAQPAIADLQAVGRLHIGADGSILLGASVANARSGIGGIGAIRLRPNGAVDRAFGGDGLSYRRPFGTYLQEGLVDVAPQSGRRVVAAGSLDPLSVAWEFHNATAVVRFTASGAPDASFARRAGFARLPRTFVNRVERAIDGSLFIAGSDQEGSYDMFGNPRRVGRVAHLSADGVPDSSWSASGVRSVLVPGSWQGIHDGLALQPSGRIALGGEWSTAHYWGDPPVPTANLLVMEGSRPARVRGWLEARLSGAYGGWRACGTTSASACPLVSTWYLTGGGWPFEARDSSRVVVQVQRRGAGGVWRSFPAKDFWVTDDGAFRAAGRVVSKGLYRFRAAVPASASTVTTYSAWSYGRK